jgi:hypothetical protein
MSSNERQRLADLLVEPTETLEVEIKAWLDMQDGSVRAKLSRTLIALANHGGGYLVFGYARRPDGTYEPAAPRPSALDDYNTDAVNGIVARFAEPEFHCATHFIIDGATGNRHPIVRVPGGQTVPIRAKRDSPSGETMQASYYIRRPGPKSEAPQSGHEWDQLMARCIQNNREALLDGIRALIHAELPRQAVPDESARLADWTKESLGRWDDVVQSLPPDSPARLPYGHYRVSYVVLGDFEAPQLMHLLGLLSTSVVRYSGWPPFWVPSREPLAPYVHSNAIECWINPEHSTFADAAHADFWRAAPDGKMFLIRGLQEDSGEWQNAAPGRRLDLTLPIYRMGECVLHAAEVAEALAGTHAEVLFELHYVGLAGRALDSASSRRFLSSHRVARDDAFENSVRASVTRMRDNLPEVLLELLSPLFALFGFFDLQPSLVNDVVREMRGYAR